MYCEGEFEGQWIRTDAIDGKILTIDVIYSGETLHRVVIAGSPITLAQAIKLHSLQPGFAEPILGSAKDRDGKTYGIADVANDIVYHCSGTEPISTVKTVTYLSADAPVLETAFSIEAGKQWKLAASSGPDSKAIHQPRLLRFNLVLRTTNRGRKLEVVKMQLKACRKEPTK